MPNFNRIRNPLEKFCFKSDRTDTPNKSVRNALDSIWSQLRGKSFLFKIDASICRLFENFSFKPMCEGKCFFQKPVSTCEDKASPSYFVSIYLHCKERRFAVKTRKSCIFFSCFLEIEWVEFKKDTCKNWLR